MELVNFNVAVLVSVDLVEAVLQSDSTLNQNLHQVIKDLILSILDRLLLLNLCKPFDVVQLIEILELLEGDDAVLICVDLIEQRADVIVLDGKVEQSGKAHMEISQAQVTIVLVIHTSKGQLNIHLLANLSLNRAEHLHFFRFLLQLALNLPVCLPNVVRDGLLQDRHRHFLLLLGLLSCSFVLPQIGIIHLLIGVGGPEASQELALGHVSFVATANARQEHLQLLVRQAQLEPVERILKLLERDRVRVVRVDQVEALRDRLVVLHQVVADALEQATLPLRRVLLVLLVQLLLHSFESIVQLLIIELVLVLVVHTEDGCQQGLLVFVKQDSMLKQ